MGRRRARILSRPKPANAPIATTAVVRKRKIDEVDIENEEQNIDTNKRRKQYKIKNTWIPISEDASIPSSSIVPRGGNSPPQGAACHETPTKIPDILQCSNKFRFRNLFTTPHCQHASPLPSLSWADPHNVWQVMLQKESMYVRDAQVFRKHPLLQPRMRAILLDWLIEVCEVYRLHRETFYLAVDYIDRYLSSQHDIVKQQLQLIGITSIFIAAKLEEIYPPKLSEFAYVTDGACTESEILDQEMIMLKVLNWDLSPMTIQAWLNIYLQLASKGTISDCENKFVVPRYSPHTFVQVTTLTDICILDTGSLQFTYSLLAASALHHMSSTEIALSVSGYKWHDIAACVQWMSPFAVTVRELGSREQKFFPNVSPDDSHNIQTHDIDLAILEKAQCRQAQMETVSRGSPDLTHISGILTPPQSNKKDGSEENYTNAATPIS